MPPSISSAGSRRWPNSTRFAADPSPSKRQDLIERLLASDEFGANWANYWRDTIAFRVPPPELTYLNYGPLTGWLARRLNGNTPWDQITRELLTATGKIEDQPAATFIGYHQAEPTNLAARNEPDLSRPADPLRPVPRSPVRRLEADAVPRVGRVFRPHESQALAKRRSRHRGLRGRQGRVRDAGHGPRQARERTGACVLERPGGRARLSPIRQRRAQLAALVASNDNPWFAKAYTNRDLGPA